VFPYCKKKKVEGREERKEKGAKESCLFFPINAGKGKKKGRELSHPKQDFAGRTLRSSKEEKERERKREERPAMITYKKRKEE